MTLEGPNNFTVSLLAPTKINPKKQSLPFLISRINQQRGSFLDITEESLEAEIRASEEQEPDPIIEGEDSEDAKPRHERLEEARQEMLDQVGHAWRENILGLNAIKLILAGHKQSPEGSQRASTNKQIVSEQAWKSLDPYYQERLPKDSLSVDIVQASQKSEAEQHNEGLVTLGWKIKAAQSVGDRLLDASARLAKEMESEARYWDQVLKIKEQGWSISRLPRERHALGVQFGFAEAHSDFRDRGTAALRRDEDGDISLDRGVQYYGNRKLRVRVLHHGKVVGCNNLSRSANSDPDEAMEDDSIESEILQARDSLFDEELHAELHREALHLTNQGVTCIDEIIQLPYEADKIIQIELIDFDSPEPGAFGDEDVTAAAVSVTLRILLSHAHRENLRRRSQPPPALTDQKSHRPVYQMLKPILEQMQHRTNCQAAHVGIAQLIRALATALPLLEIPDIGMELPGLPENLANLSNGDTPATEALIRSMIAPLHSSTSIKLPFTPARFKVEVNTNLFPPMFGTTYQFNIEHPDPSSATDTLPPTMRFTTLPDLLTYMTHVLTLELVAYISTESAGWTIVDRHMGMLSREYVTKGGKLESMSIRISLKDDELRLQWAQRTEENDSVKSGVVKWRDGEASEKGLLEIVKALAK